MLFVPQLRRQGSLLHFAPDTTQVHRLDSHILIVQRNESFVSSYTIDLAGREAEQFHTKYIPSTCLHSGIIQTCLYRLRPREAAKGPGSYGLAVLTRDRLILLDLALQTTDSFQLENTPALSILPGHACLMIASSECWAVFGIEDRAFACYYPTAASMSTSKPLPFGNRAEMLAYSLCNDAPIFVLQCGGLCKIFSGDRLIKTFKSTSRPVDRYAVCNGRVFRTRSHLVEVYRVGPGLALEDTIQSQESKRQFVDVFPVHGGLTAIKTCSEGTVSHYLYETGAELPVLYETVLELPFFSILERSNRILLKVDGQQEIENPEDLSELGSYLLLGGAADDKLFHRTLVFVLFKRFMRNEYACRGSELCRELAGFTVKILGSFDCVDLVGADIEKYFRTLISEKTLVDFLMLDFHAVGYPFIKYKDTYRLLLSANTEDSLTESCRDTAVPKGVSEVLLRTAMERKKCNLLLDILNNDCSTDRGVVDFLMEYPVECYRNRGKLVDVLLGFGSRLQQDGAGCCYKDHVERAVAYLSGFYSLIEPGALRGHEEFQYRMYKRSLAKAGMSPAAFDTSAMDLLFGVGRKDLGCILGYSLYFNSQGVLRDQERREILEKIRENIGDYVFVFDRQFVGYETLSGQPPAC